MIINDDADDDNEDGNASSVTEIGLLQYSSSFQLQF